MCSDLCRNWFPDDSGCLEICLRGVLSRSVSFAFLSRMLRTISHIFRAVMAFTKVIWLSESVSLLLLSAQLLLLAKTFCRCLSSCLFFFSSRCCSFFCFFDTWKGKYENKVENSHLLPSWGKIAHWKGDKQIPKQLPENFYSRLSELCAL